MRKSSVRYGGGLGRTDFLPGQIQGFAVIGVEMLEGVLLEQG